MLLRWNLRPAAERKGSGKGPSPLTRLLTRYIPDAADPLIAHHYVGTGSKAQYGHDQVGSATSEGIPDLK